MTMTTADVNAARRAARFYADHGWQAVPSTPERHPKVCFREFWESPAPAWWWNRIRATNVQLMAGSRWGLCVVDLDGPASLVAWRFLCRGREPIHTWESEHGPRGRHIWFRLPPDCRPLDRARVVWKGAGKHSQIEILGDHSLVMAPPSYHYSGGRYVFRNGHGPTALHDPALAPDWLLSLPSVVQREILPQSRHRPGAMLHMDVYYSGRRLDRRLVLDAIPDKVDVARRLGVRFVGRQKSTPWWYCRSIYREDRNPSAQFSEETGVYCEPKSDVAPLSLFDLAAVLQPVAYPTWMHAVAAFAQTYGVPHGQGQEGRRKGVLNPVSPASS